MQQENVKKQFKEQIVRYSQKTQGTDSYLIPFILAWLAKRRLKRTLAVCEFGGGAGQLLGVLQEKYPKASYTIAEITPEYRNYVTSKKISFQLRSVLDSKFANRSFDVLIVRDVLHHLVGKDYQETVQNQRRALLELQRLIRPGGAIFVEELTAASPFISRVMYEITNTNSRIGIRIPQLSLSPNIIVSFMTPKMLMNASALIFGVQHMKSKIITLPMTAADRLVHLGDQALKVLLIITP